MIELAPSVNRLFQAVQVNNEKKKAALLALSMPVSTAEQGSKAHFQTVQSGDCSITPPSDTYTDVPLDTMSDAQLNADVSVASTVTQSGTTEVVTVTITTTDGTPITDTSNNNNTSSTDSAVDAGYPGDGFGDGYYGE